MHEVYYNTSFRILQAFFEKILYFFAILFFISYLIETYLTLFTDFAIIKTVNPDHGGMDHELFIWRSAL